MPEKFGGWAVVAVIVLIRGFGLLNGGNLSGKYNPENLEKVPNSPLKGKSIVEAHKLAVEVSAYVCTQHGAMPVLPEKYTK